MTFQFSGDPLGIAAEIQNGSDRNLATGDLIICRIRKPLGKQTMKVPEVNRMDSGIKLE